VLVDGRRTLNVGASTIGAIGDKPLKAYLGLQDAHTAAGGWIGSRNVWAKDLARTGVTSSLLPRRTPGPRRGTSTAVAGVDRAGHRA